MVTKPASTAILGAEPPWIDYYETKSSHISHGLKKKNYRDCSRKTIQMVKISLNSRNPVLCATGKGFLVVNWRVFAVFLREVVSRRRRRR